MPATTQRPKPVVLMIFDGFGNRPLSEGNAIWDAKMPNYDALIANYPATSLAAAGISVGLRWGEHGNSEVGHGGIGTGRVIYQSLPRISMAIENETFFDSPVLKKTAEHVKKNKSTLHVVGCASNGDVHSSLEHLYAILTWAKEKRIRKVYVHAILDGRDVPRDSGARFISEVEKFMKRNRVGHIATIIGRKYAMDRNNNWEHIERAYNLMVHGKGLLIKKPDKAIKDSYRTETFDQDMEPMIVEQKGGELPVVKDNDAVLFFNFRPDRARQLTKAFVLPGFNNFKRGDRLKKLLFVTMTEYEADLPVEVIFPEGDIEDTLSDVIIDAGLKQFHIAETEKYAHVTYFLNGGREKAGKNEDFVLIPSPPCSSYDEKPEMSAKKVTDRAVKEIKSGKYDLIVMNYANPDMVAHTGNIKATIQALEFLDEQMMRVVTAVLEQDGVLAITADHGNAEQMRDPRTNEIETEHTNNPVPFIIISNDRQYPEPRTQEELDLFLYESVGVLADVAPTILDIMGLKKPAAMTGISLLPNLT
ncbi:2,3-bisphosphoglycerate-independent phosphoglycerate mutase [Patescibacteria group bacterium]